MTPQTWNALALFFVGCGLVMILFQLDVWLENHGW